MATQTPRRQRQTSFTVNPDAIYLCDNGASYCGDHLGATAKTTGRDVSGQRVMRVSAADAAWWQQHNTVGNLPMCETCHKAWSGDVGVFS